MTPVAPVVGEEERQKQKRPGLGTLNSNPNGELYGGSTTDLTGGSTIDLSAASSVNLKAAQGSLPAPAASGTSRDDITGKSGARICSGETPRDVMQDCRPGLQTGTAPKGAGSPENGPEEDGQEEGTGGGEGDGEYGFDSFTRLDSAGATGATTSGRVQPSSPNREQFVAGTNSGGQQRVCDDDIDGNGSEGGGGGQRGHPQRTQQDEGLSATPSATKDMAPLGGGSLNKEQDLRDAALGDFRKVG